MPLPFLGCGGGLVTFPDAIIADWADGGNVGPATFYNTADVAINFKVNATRPIRAVKAGNGTLYYRLNSGSWTAYAATFLVTAGQTLGWRIVFAGSGTEVCVVTVYDVARGETLDAFNASCIIA